jgi:PAS domain S-box-containing protein
MSDAVAVNNDGLVEENERLQRRIAELEAGAERFRTTLQSIGDAMISVDPGGKIVQMNPVAEALTGWGECDALGQPLARIFRIINEDTRAEVESPVERVLREGMVVGLANHTLLVAKDGRERPIADSGAPIRNEMGETTGVVLVFRDQTEERRAEKEVRAAEELFRTFFDNAPIGKSMTAPDGRLLRVNSAFGAMLGYSVEEMQTISFGAITHPDDLAESRECIRALLAGERDTWTMDKRYLAKDGRKVWTQVTTRLQRDDEGKPLRFLTHIQDITQRKRAKELVTESQRRLTEAQAVAHVGSWEWDAVRDEITGSEEFYRLFDVVPEALTRFSQFVERLHPDDRERVRQDVEAALQQKRSYDTDYRVKLCNGGWRDINARGKTFTNGGDGKAIRITGTCLDITGRKRAESALRGSEQRLRRFYDSGLLGVIFWNMRGQITDANDKFLEMVGYTRADLKDGQIDWLNMTPPEYRHLDEASVAELKATGVNKAPLEKEYIRKDGTRIPIAVAGAMLDEERVSGVAFVLDITERVRAEKALRLLNTDLEQRISDRTTQLEESNRELEAFSYSVSHDLRAPLRAIDGFTRILADDYAAQMDAEGKRLCSVVRENAKSMGKLIDDLLAFSRVGRAEMNRSPVDMGGMATAVFHELTTPATRARIDFCIGVLPPVNADPTLMRQVWTNLLSNAVKFSSKVERADIKVSAAKQQGEIVYAVKDNGAGFEMRYVGKLFRVFQRLHSVKEFEGTGVGLALVERIVRRHGGRVWAEGEPDKGATFYFALQEKGASS